LEITEVWVMMAILPILWLLPINLTMTIFMDQPCFSPGFLISSVR
jgi:hypothetical protein